MVTACGKHNLKIKIFDDQKVSYAKDSFYMSTNEDLVEKYGYFKKINLYDLIPHLNDLPIEKESFWEIQDALEIEAIDLASNYAVILKSPDCSAQVGYCEAYIIKRLRVIKN